MVMKRNTKVRHAYIGGELSYKKYIEIEQAMER